MPESGINVKIAENIRKRLQVFSDDEKGYKIYELHESDVITSGDSNKIITVMVDNSGFVYRQTKTNMYTRYIPEYAMAPKILEILENGCQRIGK